MRLTEGPDLGCDLRHDGIEREALVGQLVEFVAQMSAGLGSLDDDSVGHIAVLGEPLIAQHLGSSRRRYELSLYALSKERRQVERQACAREDDIGLFGYGRAHHVGEVGHGDHDIDADDAARRLTSLAQLLPEAVYARLAIILRIIAVYYTQAGRRNNADAALLRHGRSQSRKRYADAHAALYYGHAGYEISYFQ